MTYKLAIHGLFFLAIACNSASREDPPYSAALAERCPKAGKLPPLKIGDSCQESSCRTYFKKAQVEDLSQCEPRALFNKCEDGQIVAFDKVDSLVPTCSTIPHLSITVSDKDLKKILEKRKAALELGKLQASSEDEVPAMLNLNGAEYQASIRLKGDWPDHFKDHPWSFRIKVKQDEAILGMRKFSAQKIAVRGFGEALLSAQMRNYNIAAPRIVYVNYSFQGQFYGKIMLEEHFSRELLESMKLREGPIIANLEDDRWDPDSQETPMSFAPIRIFRNKATLKNPRMKQAAERGIGLLRGWQSGLLPSEEVFDLKKVVMYQLLVNLWGVHHGFDWINTRYYSNPVTGLLEPVSFDNAAFGIYEPKEGAKGLDWNYHFGIPSDKLVEHYPSQLELLRSDVESGEMQKFLTNLDRKLQGQTWGEEDPVTTGVSHIKTRLDFIARLFPTSGLPDQAFRDEEKTIGLPNREIKNLLHPLYLEGDGVGKLQLLSSFHEPVYVHKVTLMKKKDEIDVQEFSPPLEVQAPESVSEPLPELEVPLMAKPTYKYFVHVSREPEGQQHPRLAYFAGPALHSHWNRPHKIEELQEALPSAKISGDVLEVPSGEWTVSNSLLLPEGMALKISAGTTLRFASDARVVVRAPVLAEGTPDAPILLTALEENWPGLLVVGSEGRSRLSHLTFEKGYTASDHPFTGALTFYESDVDMSHTKIQSINGEDGLNVVRSDINFDNMTFRDTTSDALDLDFCTGIIRDAKFVNIDGDGLDTSGSVVSASKMWLQNIGDKGVSAGEASQLTLREIKVAGATNGIVAKEGSSIDLKGAEFAEISDSDLKSYIKKLEYSGECTISATEINRPGPVKTSAKKPCTIAMR